MHDSSRRNFLLSSGACIALGSMPSIVGAAGHPPDELQEWIERNAVAVRSIDAADEDFSDLEPLVSFIGGARVVQLGEPSHGAGSSFAAKVRLVKFLHRRMGFDMLVWESGLYDVEQTQAGLRGSDDPVAAAQRGILRIWSASDECRPLFEYAKVSQATGRPLDMAGFDMQFTAGGTFDRFAADLRSTVQALRDEHLRTRVTVPVEEALAAFANLHAYVDARVGKSAELSKAGLAGSVRADAMSAWEQREGVALRPRKTDLARLQRSADRLLAAFKENTAAFAEVRSARERGLMARAVANLRGYATNLYEQFGADRPAGSEAPDLARENRRDAINAANLRWLIEEGNPGRKFIVWAHNAHVMNAYYGADWRSVSLEPQADTMRPTGVFLADWLGSDVYTIGITAYEGEDGWIGANATKIAAASTSSLEGRLHRLRTPHVFLDFRAMDGQAGHPLRQPQTVRLPKYDEVSVRDVGRPYDAIFYIDQMKSATRVR